MAIPPIAPVRDGSTGSRIFNKTQLGFLIPLLAVLAMCIALSIATHGSMAHLPFLSEKSVVPGTETVKQPLVDLLPWQTAQALRPLAVSAEEVEYAREAERLADHEVDQAFAAALRQAGLATAHRTLSGDALALSQKVAQLQQLVKQDQAQVESLSPKPPAAGAAKNDTAPDDDLEVAKAQLGLDSDELADAQQDLQRASGDQSAQIQAELAAHEASMKKYDTETQGDAQVAVISVGRYRTMAALIKAWFDQRQRSGLIQQAIADAQSGARTLTSEHNALEASANAKSSGGSGTAGQTPDQAPNQTARLAYLKNRSKERQILSIDDDRIQTEQQLAKVYGQWGAQVERQHGIIQHLILGSFTWIVFILIAVVLCDALAQRLMSNPKMDRRQMETLRTIVRLGVQVLGGVLILLVIFGTPKQTPTILGLATAALTIALQDYILAFFGWFILMGKNGLRIGDWVEINGVGGEAIEIGLLSTTLLETGGLAGQGYPTGRRISFLNSFAIKGQYFNFSTAGQWMWDDITISVPADENVSELVDKIHEAAQKETEADSRLAESEWKRGTHGDSLSRFSAAPMVSLRPTGSGTDVQIRFITRASERFDVRNRLYGHAIDLLQKKSTPAPAA
jgi:small-conductance mechanosensitive channel